MMGGEDGKIIHLLTGEIRECVKSTILTHVSHLGHLLLDRSRETDVPKTVSFYILCTSHFYFSPGPRQSNCSSLICCTDTVQSDHERHTCPQNMLGLI